MTTPKEHNPPLPQPLLMLDAVVDHSVVWLNGVNPLDPQAVGAKAATLSELLVEGYAVPRGFVIPPFYFQHLLQRLTLPAPLFTDFPQSQLHLNAKNALQLWEVANTLQESLQQLAFPPDWKQPLRQALGQLLGQRLAGMGNNTHRMPAGTPGFVPCILRPSLISPPHAHRSILSVPAPIATTGILAAVVSALPRSFLTHQGEEDEGMARFWTDLRSLYGQCVQARSLLYWQQKGCSLHQLQIAVLVQPLIPALATGTIALDPDPMDQTDIKIEATWGLGFSLDRGEVLPDQHQVKSAIHLKPETPKPETSKPAPPSLRYTWTEKRGRKPLIYIHGWQSNPQSFQLAPSIVEEESEAPFRLHGIAPNHYTDPSLSPEQLQTLMNEALPYLEAHPWVKQLDWVLCPEDDLPAVLPPGFAPSSPFVWIQSEPFDRWNTIAPGIPSTVLPQVSETQASQPQASQSKILSPPIILKGEGASGGYTVGQLYWLHELVQDLPGDTIALPDYPIFVGQQLTLDVLPFLQRSLGLVLAQGGLTSHGAIMARELNIPAVVGLGQRVEQILQTLPPQTWLAVDGDRGVVKVLVHPPDLTLAAWGNQAALSQNPRSNSLTLSTPLDPMTIETETCLTDPTDSTDPTSRFCLLPPVSPVSPSITATRLLTTINQFSSLKPLATQTSDGIGLLRSEWLFLDLLEQQHPIVWINQGRQAELADRFRDRLQDCIAAVHPNPVFYRSFDCRAAELQQLQGLDCLLVQGEHSQATANLNWRIGGTLSHCLDPRVLDLELAVLHQVDRLGSPLHLLLPMVRTVEEFVFCRDRLRQWTTFPPQPISLWMMAEVPSVLLLLPELVKAGVEGIAIGPGDLAQYLLGIDRDAGGVYGLDHPVVHQAILNLLRQAEALNIPATLCSHLSRQGICFPDGYLDAYIQAGLWGITTELPHLPFLRQKVAQAEQRLILNQLKKGAS